MTTSSTYKIKNISIYDGMGRLKSEVESDITKSYTYDLAGNRATMTVSGLDNPVGNRATMTVSGLDNYTTTYSYDRNNRLLTETKDSGDALATVTYAYDANGNQLSKVGGTLSSSIGNPVIVGLQALGHSGEENSLVAEINTYNAFNQLTQVQTARHSVSYAYKADGLRTSKTSNGQTTSFVWDGSNIAAENRGGEYQTYTRGIGLIRNGAGQYYLFDAHGDVVQMAGAGGVVREYKYDAFGNEVEPDEDDTNPFRYCGEYWDAETGNIYLRNRYYSPSNGRFTSEDPIADGLNWYTYCNGNPVVFVDPSGLAAAILSSAERRLKQLGISATDMPINIIETDTSITIYAFINIGGTAANLIPNYDYRTYSQLAIEGIKKNWSGTYNKKKVNVKITEVAGRTAEFDAIGQAYFDMTLHKGLGVSQHSNNKKWSVTTTGYTEVYTGDSRDNKYYNYSGYTSTVAHEFGHAMGLADIYNDPFIPDEAKFPSIMNDQFEVDGAQPIDYGMILANRELNGKQYYSYERHRELLKMHNIKTELINIRSNK